LVEHDYPDFSLTRQAELLGISRTSLYYKPVPVSERELEIMNLIDKIYLKYPFFGARRIKKELKREHKIQVNRKCISRLLKKMGIEAIYPKPNLSRKDSQNKIYPYLLRNLKIDHPNQVWGTDITYVRLAHGFCYLTAVMDWFSRRVISWQLSGTLEIEFILENLKRALKINIPEIFNSDQGSHFTSVQYTDMLNTKEIRISMDGRGRCLDNIFTERLWRSVKYEDIYIKSYQTIDEARIGLTDYFEKYNDRFHSSLDDYSPNEVYFNKINNKLIPDITI
jgi:putative transposase